MTDVEGNPQPNIRFDLVDQVPIYIKITANTLGTEQPISSNLGQVIADEVLARARADFSEIGRNQLGFEYVGIVFDLQNSGEISGVVSVTAELSLTGLAGPYADPIEIGIRERPRFESPQIQVIVIAL